MKHIPTFDNFLNEEDINLNEGLTANDPVKHLDMLAETPKEQLSLIDDARKAILELVKMNAIKWKEQDLLKNTTFEVDAIDMAGRNLYLVFNMSIPTEEAKQKFDYTQARQDVSQHMRSKISSKYDVEVGPTGLKITLQPK